MDNPERTRLTLEQALRRTFSADIDALKPGNVHRHAPGHGMRCEDFEASARVTVPPLCDARLRVGRRILDSITATRAAVGCNTNLGMVLLMAPIAAAFQRTGPGTLGRRIEDVLAELTPADAAEVYEAIRLAQPGGLGSAPDHDVCRAPDTGLLEAMSAAAGRDRVAHQYANGFNDLRTLGVPGLGEYHRRWNSVEWALTGCYLRFLAAFRTRTSNASSASPSRSGSGNRPTRCCSCSRKIRMPAVPEGYCWILTRSLRTQE